MTIERWLAVVGHEGFYEVSDLGRVRSVDRFVKRRFGRAPIAHKICRVRTHGKLLNPGLASNGYLTVSLCGETKCVHALVLEAFVGPRPTGADCCHRNGDRTQNALANLRWDTRCANINDKKAHGTFGAGEACSYAKLTAVQVAEIRRRKGVVSQSRLAEAFGVSPSCVQAIHDGKTWKDVA